MSEQIIPFDSDEAAQVITITGWQSRPPARYDGYVGPATFWGDNERAARWNGCTHVKCGTCGDLVEKSRVYCKSCIEKRNTEKYTSAKRAPWNGHMLYSDAYDKYFDDLPEVAEWLEDNFSEDDEPHLSTLRLYLCEPKYASESAIDDDLFYDILSDDGEVPDAIREAMDAFNKALEAYKEPLSFWPTDIALELPVAASSASKEG